ncbi:hypothetical protein ISTM_338 [Insectomime virus]|nr:hypothetical protein ISTM_338 [Insectomime virus]
MSTKTAMSNRERSKKFREANREKTRESAKAWYWRNREKVLEKRVEERKLLETQKAEIERLRTLVSQHGIQV